MSRRPLYCLNRDGVASFGVFSTQPRILVRLE